MDTDEAWVIRQLWYRGRFLSAEDKIWHGFVASDSGAEHYYSKAMAHPVIGALYDVEMQGTKARIQDAKQSADWLEAGTELHPDAEQWRVEDQAAYLAKQGADAAKRMATHNTDIDNLTLGQIKAMIAKQPTHVRNGTRLVVMEYLR